MDTLIGILKIIGAIAIIIVPLWITVRSKQKGNDRGIYPVHPDIDLFSRPDELVTIARFSNASYAEMWQMRLRDEGVDCVITGNISSRIGGNHTGIEAKVRAADAEHALELLQE